MTVILSAAKNPVFRLCRCCCSFFTLYTVSELALFQPVLKFFLWHERAVAGDKSVSRAVLKMLSSPGECLKICHDVCKFGKTRTLLP